MKTFCPEQNFGHLLREVSQLWRSLIDRRLEPLGLSAARWQPLLVLHRADMPMTQSMIAGALDIEAPSLVRLLDRLGEDGWVERRKCPQDRRAYHVVLTPKARKICADVEQVLSDTRSEVLTVLDDKEVDACVDALNRVRIQALNLLHDGAPPEEHPLMDIVRRPRRTA